MTNVQKNFKPLSLGETYFTQIGEIFRIKSRQYIKVKCRCGVIKNVRLDGVFNGSVKSCGCYKAEREKYKTATRGGIYFKLYDVWRAIKRRCYDPKSISYKFYGAKGIWVCDEWKNNQDAFIDWALNNGYKKGLQIDRINNKEGYSPENCRLVTPIENIRNNSKTIHLTINGETKSLPEWADIYKLPRQKLRYRYKNGCPLELLFSPARRVNYKKQIARSLPPKANSKT